jgi:hypothetical protein
MQNFSVWLKGGSGLKQMSGFVWTKACCKRMRNDLATVKACYTMMRSGSCLPRRGSHPHPSAGLRGVKEILQVRMQGKILPGACMMKYEFSWH